MTVLLHQVCTYHQILRCWITMHAQLRSVRLYIEFRQNLRSHSWSYFLFLKYSPAAQRSAVRSRAVRCRALRSRCCVVLRCVPYCEHRAVPGTIIRVVVYCFSSFFFSYMYLIFHGPLFFPKRKLPPYCRSERNTGNKSTQHS